MQLSVNLAGDIFLNFVLSAAVEVTNRFIVVAWKYFYENNQMPSVVVGMIGMDCIGRVSLLVTCQLIGGVRWLMHDDKFQNRWWQKGVFDDDKDAERCW